MQGRVDGDILRFGDARRTDDEVCDAVAAYLGENPRAMDTLEGIAAWWVPRHQIRLDVERVWRALELLKERGVVEEFSAADVLWYRLKVPIDESSTRRPSAAPTSQALNDNPEHRTLDGGDACREQ
jgi:hypothetical protein